MSQSCDLCNTVGGELFWQDDFCRVILLTNTDFPGFCRVVLNAHVKEMTDLSESEQQRLMRVVFKVEQAVRDVLKPEKINLASLGNKTPHLHWHVTPRYEGDATFPNSIWSTVTATPRPPLNIEETAQLKAKVIQLLAN